MKFKGVIDIIDHNRKLISMRIQYAELILANDLNNNDIYNALSHLAQIPELYINLNRYENLRVYPNSVRLNTDMYLYAKRKLQEAKEL